MMKYFELKKDEAKLLKEFETGKLRPIKSRAKETKRYQQYAQSNLSKTRNINIRLTERDLRKIKVLAANKGLPYQTFISSLLHQYSHSEE